MMLDDAVMCAHHEKQEEAGHQNQLIPIAWAILVMGLSLAAVILLYLGLVI